mgnify:CR=1 FL=1
MASCFRICRGEIVPGSAEKETHAHLSKYDAFRGIQLLLQALDEIKSYNERHERIDRAEIGRPDSSKNALTPGEQAELAAFQERDRSREEQGDEAKPPQHRPQHRASGPHASRTARFRSLENSTSTGCSCAVEFDLEFLYKVKKVVAVLHGDGSSLKRVPSGLAVADGLS